MDPSTFRIRKEKHFTASLIEDLGFFQGCMEQVSPAGAVMDACQLATRVQVSGFGCQKIDSLNPDTWHRKPLNRDRIIYAMY